MTPLRDRRRGFVSANATVLANPCGLVMRAPGRRPGRGSATIQASYGCARRWSAATISIRSRRVVEIPLQSNTVRGMELRKKPRNPPTFAVEQAAEVGATTIVSVGQ